MGNEVTVVFPDYLGRAIRDHADPSGFISRVRGVLGSQAVLFPVINGFTNPTLTESYKTIASDLGMRPLVYEGDQGLLGALHYAYTFISMSDIHGPIIRLDTSEHPPEAIPQLLRELQNAHMVVGDLDCSNGTMVAGSFEELAHTKLFPETFGWATGGRLRLSSAHGMQGWRSATTLGKIFEGAYRINVQLRETLGTSVSWGMDAAMALSAVAQSFRVHVSPVKAEILRDRSPDKIIAQLNQSALQMCFAARKVYPHLAK